MRVGPDVRVGNLVIWLVGWWGDASIMVMYLE